MFIFHSAMHKWWKSAFGEVEFYTLYIIYILENVQTPIDAPSKSHQGETFIICI